MRENQEIHASFSLPNLVLSVVWFLLSTFPLANLSAEQLAVKNHVFSGGEYSTITLHFIFIALFPF